MHGAYVTGAPDVGTILHIYFHFYYDNDNIQGGVPVSTLWTISLYSILIFTSKLHVHNKRVVVPKRIVISGIVYAVGVIVVGTIL